MGRGSQPDEVVRGYATAQSAGDLVAVVNACHPDVVRESIPFRLLSRGRHRVREAVAALLRTFPDYDVRLGELRLKEELVVGTGLISATMEAPLAGLPATGRRFTLSFASLWKVHDGLIHRELLFFDLNHMCEQLGLSTCELAAHLRSWRLGLQG
ncbi:hypothetical protein FH608_040580 [Nonomuraea phyllanthi]|uniref:Uncharacterized protein n=1 Tax=Nonomuraea phyllanthi TaxID=2219224 RepID=A0A5C4VIQ0_9ACTN|nr:ester cyclase [Nonomuraea phyllanthi]KAB8189144.1 hypothetical protein FH608_040580 [Nonomuraea phyllanthi]QFY10235.1 hypothetical protein GBF35_29615 [Nonomuraea phyllanthi]